MYKEEKMCRCHNTNCKKVIQEYHCLLEKMDEIFEKADMLIYVEAYREICEAIKKMKESMCLIEKAIEISKEADMFLEESGCQNRCNKECCKCKELEEKANNLYALENEGLIDVLELLEKAAWEIMTSYKIDQKADKVKREYIKCVHENIEKHEKNRKY